MCLDFLTEWAKFQIILNKPDSFADMSPHISHKIMLSFDIQLAYYMGFGKWGDLNKRFFAYVGL